MEPGALLCPLRGTDCSPDLAPSWTQATKPDLVRTKLSRAAGDLQSLCGIQNMWIGLQGAGESVELHMLGGVAALQSITSLQL